MVLPQCETGIVVGDIMPSRLGFFSLIIRIIDMKKLALASAIAMSVSLNVQAAELTSNTQIINYGVGHNIGTQILNDGTFTLNVDAFIAGLQDGMANVPMAIDAAQIEEAFAELQRMQEEKRALQFEIFQAQSNAYLAENGAKDGVVTTESGLQYRVLVAGEGSKKPTIEDSVTTHYHGTLMDGAVFDSSVDRGEPVQFPLAGVIEGWTEALQLMTIGDKWELVIPPELAYGENPPGSIPPNSVLIFEVELLGIDTPQ
jgi:FKBP-type peptidyl-prolyl cis-trans isomerase FklB